MASERVRYLAARWLLCLGLCVGAPIARGQSATAEPQKVIIDTDIGDDVDDAFALALAVKSPELRVLGVTTTFGDTEARAKITDRFLGEVGRADIPVMAGKATATKNPMSQTKIWRGGHFVKASHGDAVTFLLDQIRKYPGEITLIAIGPLMNVGVGHRSGCGHVPETEASGADGRIGEARVW